MPTDVAMDAGGCAFVASQAPPLPRCTRQTPLVLMAGMGKTGTMSVTIALSMLGLKVGHYNCVKTCRIRGVEGGCKASDVIDDPLLTGEFITLRQALGRLSAPALNHAGLCNFSNVDAIGDVPVAHLAPLIYRAHGPGTKVRTLSKYFSYRSTHTSLLRVRAGGAAERQVVLTLRPPESWLRSRLGWGADDVVPLGWTAGVTPPLGASIFAPGDAAPTSVAAAARAGGGAGVAWAYLAQVALLACLVRSEDLLILDLAAELPRHAASAEGRAASRRLWTKLASFVGRSRALADFDTARFPHVSTAFCGRNFSTLGAKGAVTNVATGVMR
jgi:hypothetical protein